MKLKNLLFATMFACAFASCSSDDDPVIDNGGGGTPVAKDEAVLVLNMAGVQTRANIGTAKENEINVATTKVVIFNGYDDDAVLEKAVSVFNQGGSKDNKISLTPGNKKVLVLANYKGNIASDITYGNFKKTKIDFAGSEGQDGGYLTMNSAVYTISLEAGKINYLGYEAPDQVPSTENYFADTNKKPVYLYHNVAKVTLNNIVVNAKEGLAAKQYPNPSLVVKEVFILHAHKKSQLFTENSWGVTNVTDNYLNAHSNDTYADWVKTMEGKKPIYKYITTSIYENAGYEVENFNITLGFNSAIDNENNTIGEGASLPEWNAENNKSFYTYENTNIGAEDYYTLLVVKGDFSYDGYENKQVVRKTDANRYYTVAVGVTGFDKGYNLPAGVEGLTTSLREANFDGKYKGVIRNLQYRVSMTVTGPGYTTPFGPKNDEDTFLAVNVKVVEFGNVDQDASFE